MVTVVCERCGTEVDTDRETPGSGERCPSCGQVADIEADAVDGSGSSGGGSGDGEGGGRTGSGDVEQTAEVPARTVVRITVEVEALPQEGR